MKSLNTKLVLIGAAVALGGCANIGSGQTMKTGNAPFFGTIQSEYNRLGKLEMDEADWFDGFFFYRRARRAANGETFGPQELKERTLPGDMLTEMTDARNRLIAALPAGIASKPEVAARAQAGFDCWMQEQEENFQPDDIAACKTGFFAALDELEVKPVVQSAPSPAPMAMPKVEPMPAVPAPVVINFGFDKSRVTLAARAIIKDLAAKAKAAKVTKILIDAHADKAGPDAYNRRLAAARVTSISGAFVNEGVPASMIQARSFGEAQPVVPTADGQRLRANRRVEISFERN